MPATGSSPSSFFSPSSKEQAAKTSALAHSQEIRVFISSSPARTGPSAALASERSVQRFTAFEARTHAPRHSL
jgi:hypothetical protein